MSMKRDDGRYARQIMLKEIGEEGQKRLCSASVLIVGVGGLGSLVATYLNGAGVGKIGLVDNDMVSLSNIHRQFLYTERQVGELKVGCAMNFLAARSSSTEYVAYPEALREDNAAAIIADYDMVVDCTDNFCTRFLIDDICHHLGKWWVYGAIGESEGRVSVFGGRTGKRFDDLYSDRESLCSLPRAAGGVTGPIAGVIGSLEALQAVRVITGEGEILSGKLLIIDFLTYETNIIEY